MHRPCSIKSGSPSDDRSGVVRVDNGDMQGPIVRCLWTGNVDSIDEVKDSTLMKE